MSFEPSSDPSFIIVLCVVDETAPDRVPYHLLKCRPRLHQVLHPRIQEFPVPVVAQDKHVIRIEQGEAFRDGFNGIRQPPMRLGGPLVGTAQFLRL